MPQIMSNIAEIEKAIKRLSIEEKIVIFEKLGKETRKERWKNLLSRIEKRYKQYPISDREIANICNEVRKRRYEKKNKSSY
jgi:isopropylmalate/homocitrate/citramalate synthase